MKKLDTVQIKKLQKIMAVRQAVAEVLTEKAHEVDKLILDLYDFKSIDGGYVKDVKQTYLITDDDSELYYHLRKIGLREAGMGHPKDEEGVSTELVAQNKVSKMKKRIFDYVMDNMLPKDMADTLRENPFKMVKGKWVFDTVVDNFMSLKV